MAKKKSAPELIPPNPKRVKASKASTAGKRASSSISKVSEPLSSSPVKGLAEPSSASDPLAPVVSFFRERFPAEKAQEVLRLEPLERLNQATDLAISVSFDSSSRYLFSFDNLLWLIV